MREKPVGGWEENLMFVNTLSERDKIVLIGIQTYVIYLVDWVPLFVICIPDTFLTTPQVLLKKTVDKHKGFFVVVTTSLI